MTLAETNTPYEFELVDLMKGEHKQAAHLSRQPFGVVPTLKDGDLEMYESRAMCRYINEKVHGALIPSNIQARAQMEQWISIESANFSSPVLKFVFHYVMQREQTPEALKTAGEQITTALSVMDKQLAKHPFIAGETFTLADICFMPYFGYALATPAKDLFPKHAHVMAWWNKVSARPTWQKVTA